jgi:hypothetical protein
MKYQLLEHVSLTEVDDEVVLLNLDSGAYYGLNHVGSKLMQGIRNHLDLAQVIGDISEQYQTDRQQVQTDAEELIAQLLKEQLISIQDEAG